MKLVDQTIRRFTLLPRCFFTFYWFQGNFCFRKWWQWGRRCFFVHTKIFVRPTFSTWEQIKSRAKIDDKDAKIIRQCIANLNVDSNYTSEEIYNEIIKQVK